MGRCEIFIACPLVSELVRADLAPGFRSRLRIFEQVQGALDAVDTLRLSEPLL